MTSRIAIGSVVMALLVTGGRGAEGPAQDTPPDPQRLAQAHALARASSQLASIAGPALSPPRARRYAARLARRIPLPAGGRFTGIRWPADRAGVTPGLVEHVLEYNARCQWLRAAAEGREAGTAGRILPLTLRWPALRRLRPLPSGPAELAGCYATARREAAFARSRRWTPSS